MPKQILYDRFKFAGHILFWLFSQTILLSIFYYYETQIHFDLFVKALVTNIGFAFGVYVNLYVLIPKFLKPKNYIFYIFWVIVVLSFSSISIQLLLMFPLRNILHISENFNSFDTNLHSAFFFATLIYVGFTSFLKFIKDWLSMQDLNFKLTNIEKQKLEAELKTLKGQLNPHFLFNSLNNIYSLALIKSDKVPDLILKLSDLMRHIIYESKENYIPLEKEIEFVDNFVALQKIRIQDQTKITYKIEGEIPSAKIAPLLFEPFIDNAFKHGLPGTNSSDFISIIFNFKQPGYIQFTLENNYEDLENWNNKNSGIGITNVKQRLTHLYHPSEYNLEIQKKYFIHFVYLKLKLK